MIKIKWETINEICKETFKINQDFEFLYECKYGLVVAWRDNGVQVRELLENKVIKEWFLN